MPLLKGSDIAKTKICPSLVDLIDFCIEINFLQKLGYLATLPAVVCMVVNVTVSRRK